jgi:hypothetical protein
MKTTAIIFGLLVVVLFDGCAASRTGQANENRFVCVAFHQAALYQRAGLYHQKFGRWPTNVQDLVEAHLLPEFSAVHICPSEREAEILGNGTGVTVGDLSFVESNHLGSTAAYYDHIGRYSHSPYRFSFDGTNFVVICTKDHSHTPALTWRRGQTMPPPPLQIMSPQQNLWVNSPGSGSRPNV